MKNLSILFLITLLSMGLMAQNKYEEAMRDALNNFGNAATLADLQATASQFERIAEVETTKWIPLYYASLVNCVLSFKNENQQKKEVLVNQSQSQLNKAFEVAPDETELHALQGMVYQAFITLDPMNNGQAYAAKANDSFEKALQLNAENPRPYYLQANALMYTPEQYGGGKKVALPLFEKAMEFFNKSNTENDFYPNWGKEDCEKNIKACKQD